MGGGRQYCLTGYKIQVNNDVLLLFTPSVTYVYVAASSLKKVQTIEQLSRTPDWSHLAISLGFPIGNVYLDIIQIKQLSPSTNRPTTVVCRCKRAPEGLGQARRTPSTALYLAALHYEDRRVIQGACRAGLGTAPYRPHSSTLLSYPSTIVRQTF